MRLERATAEAVSVTTRSAREGDLPRVLTLLEESGLPTAGVEECFDSFVLAEAGGEVVGAIGMERFGSHGLLRSAAVTAAWQGRGVGRLLVEEILARAAASGASDVHLLTTTAEGWFPAFGFVKTTREAVPAELMASRELQDACPATATVMQLRLSG